MAKQFEYIMVTDLSDHWDQINKQDTSYPIKMFKGSMKEEYLRNNFPTIFVRLSRNQNKEIERVWKGVINNIRKDALDSGKYRFNVQIDSLVENDIQQYRDFSIGWHLRVKDSDSTVEAIQKSQINTIYQPKFFEILRTTLEWRVFEEYTWYLLKLIGINIIYRFPLTEQQGKADGFFKFQHLAVIYDCTLEEKFEQVKKQQIGNYYEQIKRGQLSIRHEIIEDFEQYIKQIWIITKGENTIIQTRGEIVIKEVSVQSLIDFYNFRLITTDNIIQIEKRLQDI